MGIFAYREWKKIGLLIALTAGVYLSMRFLVPLVLPFLLAFFIVTLLNPFITKLHKTSHIGKGCLAGGLLLIILIALLGILGIVFGKIFYSAGDWLGECNVLKSELCFLISNCCRQLETGLGINADVIENFVLENVNIFIENMQVQVIPKLMGESFSYVKAIVSAGAGIIVTVISVVLLAKDYEAIRKSLLRHAVFQTAAEIYHKLGAMLAVFLKSEGIIMLVISGITFLGFWIIGMENPLGLGLITGFFDFLPFIGTGIMLLPLALFSLLQGELFRGIGAIVIYAVCSVTRELLEPKLIGNKMGIFPIAILIAIYLGIKLYGFQGILLGPLSFLLIAELQKRLLPAEENR